MGAYDNPDVNVGVDRQSGRMIGQAIAGIGQQIGGAVAAGAEKKAAAEKEFAERKRKEAEKDRIRAEQNWRIRKQVESQKTNEIINFKTKVAAENVKLNSLDGSFNTLIDDYYTALKTYESSSGDYEGREEDEALIRNSKSFIDNIGERFGTMKALTSEYREKVKRIGKAGGVDPEATDPRFSAMMLIGDGNGEGLNSGSISWTTRKGPGGKIQMFQVAKSEEIRKENIRNKLADEGLTGEYLNNAVELTYDNEKGNFSDEYELSFDQINGIFEDDDNNPNTFGPFSIIQDDAKQIITAGKAENVLGEDGKLIPGDPSKPGSGTITLGEKITTTDSRGQYTEQKTWPNTAKIIGLLTQDAENNATADLQWSGSQATANSNIRTNSNKTMGKIVDGKFVKDAKGTVTQYSIPQYGEMIDGEMVYRKPNGELIVGPEMVLGDSVNGILSQDFNEQGTEETMGYSKEEFDKYVAFGKFQYMNGVGAFDPVSSQPAESRVYDFEFSATERAQRAAANVSSDTGLDTNSQEVISQIIKPGGFVDFFTTATSNMGAKTEEIDGVENLVFEDGNGNTQKIPLNNKTKVTAILKETLKKATGEKSQYSTKGLDINAIVKAFIKNKFPEDEVQGTVNENKGVGKFNNLTNPKT